jgi:sec-independent protein translocase protein TatB
MFDPGFFELVVICIVALVVLGPDKLPGAIKTMGLWIGRLRRSFNNIKREIEQEVGADEIRRQLRNEAIMEKFKNTKNQVTESIESIKKEADSVKNDLDIKKEFTDLTGESKPPVPASRDEKKANDVDPVEKLATNDPAARVISPTGEEISTTDTTVAPQNNTSTAEASDSDKPASGEKPEQ